MKEEANLKLREGSTDLVPLWGVHIKNGSTRTSVSPKKVGCDKETRRRRRWGWFKKREGGRRKILWWGPQPLLPQLSLPLSLSFLSFFSFASFFSLSLSLLFYFVAKATHKQLTTHILNLDFLLVSFYPLSFSFHSFQ